jgi:hypothetical protein
MAHHAQHHNQAVSGIPVVVHHKDAALRVSTGLFAFDRPLWRRYRTIRHRQMNDELAAFA